MAIQLPIVSTFNNKGVKQAQSSIGRFTKSIAGVGAAIGAAFAIRAVTNFTRESISSASDLAESMNAVQVAFGDAGDAVIKLGEDAASRLGVAQSAFNGAAVRFSAFAERVVGEGGDVAGFIDDITVRATDFASVFNIDVSEALQVFQSGLAGEAEPLKRFGINLLQAEVQAYALESGLIEVGETMTEQEKVQARYGLLMQETAKTAGDFANTSDGLANSQRILAANFEDIRAAVGTALLPVLEDLSAVVKDDVIPPLMEFFENDFPGLIESAKPLAEGFVDVLGEVGEGVKQLLDIPEDTSLLEGILDRISDLQADPEFQEFMGELRDIFVELAPVVPDLAIGVAELAKAIAPLLGDAAEETAPTLSAFASILGDLAESVRILTGTVPDADKEFRDFEVTFLDFIPVIGSYLGEDGLIVRLAGAVRTMRERLQEEQPQIALFLETFSGMFKRAFEDTGAAVQGTLGLMGEVFSSTFTKITERTMTWREEQLIAIRGAIEEMYEAGLEVLQGLWDGLTEKFVEIAGWFAEIPGRIKAFFDELPADMREIGGDIMTGLWDGLKSIWPRIISWVKEKVREIKERFKDAMKIGSPSKVFEGYGQNIVEGLLNGLNAYDPELNATVDALMPVPESNGMMPFSTRPTGSSVTINIQSGVGDPVRIGEEVVTAIKRYERASGPVFASA